MKTEHNFMVVPTFARTVGFICTLIPALAMAQSEESDRKIGIFTPSGSAKIELAYDSNLFARPNSSGSMKETINLEGALTTGSDSKKVTLGAKMGIGNVEDFSEDDYVDIGFSAGFDWKPAARHSFAYKAILDYGHDDRGSDDTAIQSSPNEWEYKAFKADYTFGSDGAKGRIKFAVDINDKEYTNNRSTTAALDLTSAGIGGTFFWRVAPKTNALFELRRTSDDYKDVATLRDSDLTDALVGVTWSATAKTSGSFKVGYSERDFDSATRQDYDTNILETTITWRPREHSTVQLNGSRSIDNASAAGDDSIVNTRMGIKWSHQWSALWATEASAGYTEADYNNAANRKDETTDIGLSISYQPTRYWTITGSHFFTDKQSNSAGVAYDRNITAVSANLMF